jgi:hypothetical protein
MPAVRAGSDFDGRSDFDVEGERHARANIIRRDKSGTQT